MSDKKLTEADIEALSLLPTDWFDPKHLPIHRPMYRCERLEERGMLLRRVVGKWPNCWSEYKKLEERAA